MMPFVFILLLCLSPHSDDCHVLGKGGGATLKDCQSAAKMMLASHQLAADGVKIRADCREAGEPV